MIVVFPGAGHSLVDRVPIGVRGAGDPRDLEQGHRTARRGRACRRSRWTTPRYRSPVKDRLAVSGIVECQPVAVDRTACARTLPGGPWYANVTARSLATFRNTGSGAWTAVPSYAGVRGTAAA